MILGNNLQRRIRVIIDRKKGGVYFREKLKNSGNNLINVLKKTRTFQSLKF